MTKQYSHIKQVSEHADVIFREIAKRKGFFDYRFLTNWSDIVGMDLATKCIPQRLIYSPILKNSILIILSEDVAFKSMFTHYKVMILDKVRFYFGQSSITEVRLAKK